MTHTRVQKMTAGVMTVFMVGMSVLPGLAAAQAVDESSSTEAAAVEQPTATPSDTAEAVQAETTSTVSVYEVIDTPETNHSLTVTSNEVAETLSSLDGLLDESSDVVATTDADSAAIVETENAVVDIPVDPEEPIVFAAEGMPEIEITLPNSGGASTAKMIDEGVVAYSAADGSANAVQADEEGGVKMLTVIDNDLAPTSYAYGITVPEGGSIEIAEDGSAVVMNFEHEKIANVAKPWATDAAGNSVETWFETDGTTLMQYVIHNVEGVVYPVTADPLIFAPIIYWAASTCAASVIEGLTIDAVVSAFSDEDWVWKEEMKDSVKNCVGGLILGPVLSKFIPTPTKSQIKKIVRLTKKILRWTVKELD